MNTAYLSLGTNLGNKLENLKNALQKLKEIGSVTHISSIYQTPPWGFNSDDFYNISICLKTNLTAFNLLDKLLFIEKELGRKRNGSKGYQARPLDIDIIFFNDEIINTENLILPHPRMEDRKFVLIPTIEIVSNFIHPVYQKTLETLLEITKDDSEIAKTNHQLIT